jgi:antitoxin MazE
MKVDLIRVGNSRGIRIPKALIEECGLGDSVELSVADGRLVIERHRPLRDGWAEAFRRNAARDELLLDLPASEFDRSEWKW